jgi:hypothetical protein
MSNFYCLPGRAGGTPVALEVRWKKRASRVVTSEATPMRRSAADAPAVVTATQRLKHNALIVCITPHPCLSVVVMITPAPRKCNPDRHS